MSGIRYKGQIFSGTASTKSADEVSYDNTESGLTATDVQGAIDELEDAKYEKPSGGIPASDLSSAVQTSLGKADTALQSQDIESKILWYPNQSIASTNGNSGTLCTITNSAISADHLLVNFFADNPANIISDVTWNTSAGSLVLTGKSTAATTATIILAKKDN